MISEKDIFKLNEMILSKNNCNSNLSVKNVFFSKEIIGIYISAFLIIAAAITIKAATNKILIGISLVILTSSFLYSFLFVVFMTIKSYYDATIEILNVSKNAAKTFLIENEVKQKVFLFLNELNSKEQNFPANYVKHLRNEINDNRKNMNYYFGGIQTLSLVGMVSATFNAASKFKELLSNNNYFEIFIIVIPIIVSYWVYIEKKKRNKINKIIYYVSEWEKTNTTL